MLVTVVVAYEEQLTSPGVRIRYNRIAGPLRAAGHSFDIVQIEDLRTTQTFRSDIYLFSKCQDVRSILLAEAMSERGKQVGIDVFDDYFSQSQDNRLTHLRDWLQGMSRHCSFVLCATETMRARLVRLCPGLPVHRMNDPLDKFDKADVAPLLADRIDLARQTGRVGIVWFGIGDNPYFPVGVDDLCALGDTLAGLRRHGFVPHLQVLTNRRAMTADRLARLARLPLPVYLREWTLERETALLRSSLVAFLPVNAQPFSTAKSLNRAVTALSQGAQVLSAGFPLYAPFDPLIYRSIDDLGTDLAAGRMRLRDATRPALAARLAAMAAPDTESKGLLEFLSGLVPRAKKLAAEIDTRPIVVLHGVSNSGRVHKFVQRSKMFSASGPFQDAAMNFDIMFDLSLHGRTAILLSERVVSLLKPDATVLLEPFARDAPMAYFRLALNGSARPTPAAFRFSERLALYATGIAAARDVIAQVLPGVRIVVSEQAAPFRMRAAEPGLARLKAHHA